MLSNTAPTPLICKALRFRCQLDVRTAGLCFTPLALYSGPLNAAVVFTSSGTVKLNSGEFVMYANQLQGLEWMHRWSLKRHHHNPERMAEDWINRSRASSGFLPSVPLSAPHG